MTAAPEPLVPLTALVPSQTATVADVRVGPEHRSRLLEMGLVTGTLVELVRFAPLGDPVEIKVRGYRLTVPRHEAEQIWVRPGWEGGEGRQQERNTGTPGQGSRGERV